METEAPEGWSEAKLGEIAQFQPGFAFKSSDFSQSSENSVPLIRIRDLQKQAPDIYVDNNFDRRFRVERGDILVGMDGDFNCVEWRQAEAALNQRVLKIEALSSDKKFLHYLVQPVLRALEDQISGTTVKHLSTKHLKSFAVAVPPLAEQQRIAEILTAVDESIRAGERVIEQTERVKRGLMKELFESVDGDGSKLGEIFTVRSSKRVLQKDWRSEGVPFYRGREITKLTKLGRVNNEVFIEEALFEKLKERYGVPREGDILVTAIGTIGNSYLVKRLDKFYFKDASVLWLSKKANFDSVFVYHWMRSELFHSQLDTGHGTTVDTLTIKKLGDITLKLPSFSEQQRIAAILTSVDDQIDAERKHVEQQKRVKQGLMDDLLTGKVRTV